MNTIYDVSIGDLVFVARDSQFYRSFGYIPEAPKLNKAYKVKDIGVKSIGIDCFNPGGKKDMWWLSNYEFRLVRLNKKELVLPERI